MNKSNIQWTDYTWNPTTGCSHESEGCRYCYAERLARRWGSPEWTAPNASQVVHTHPERLDQPFGIKTPSRIFVNSMSDLFHELVPDNFIKRVWITMANCEHHTFQILTKRPKRVLELLTADDWPQQIPLPNVWLGFSAEDQTTFDERWAIAQNWPAHLTFVSAEPLLGPIDFRDSLELELQASGDNGASFFPHIGWVIAGGESGGPADRQLVKHCGICGRGSPTRDCSHCKGQPWSPTLWGATWAREIRDQCTAAGTPFFWKQWGGPSPKSGGRILDGRTWDEFPDLEGATQ